MSGRGQRFIQAGYNLPKPLILVHGKSMISRVIENFNEISEYIFIVLEDHLKQFNLTEYLPSITDKKTTIISVNSVTEGAACSVLLAKHLIDNDEELLIINSDQLVEFDSLNFNILRTFTKSSGIIFTFNNSDPKWSYVKLNDKNQIIQIAEKQPISNIATCGCYWFRTGKLLVAAIESMISKNIRFNNEFYLAPCYNELVNEYVILPFMVSKMIGLGTPEDLERVNNDPSYNL